MRRFVPLFALFLLSIFFVGCEATPDYVFPVTDTTDGDVSDRNAPDSDGEVNSSHATDAESSVEDEALPDTPSGITVLSLTDNVSRGCNAFLSIRGTPGITYRIEVYYSTTISQAKGLEPKTTDRDGTVAWSWRVGSSTKAGTHRIVIRGENGETLTLYFTTTESS